MRLLSTVENADRRLPDQIDLLDLWKRCIALQTFEKRYCAADRWKIVLEQTGDATFQNTYYNG